MDHHRQITNETHSGSGEKLTTDTIVYLDVQGISGKNSYLEHELTQRLTDTQDEISRLHRNDMLLVNCQAPTAEERDAIAPEYLKDIESIHFIYATETWLREDASVNLDGYKLISSFCRRDLGSREMGGGVAVWGADHLEAEAIENFVSVHTSMPGYKKHSFVGEKRFLRNSYFIGEIAYGYLNRKQCLTLIPFFT